MRSLKDNFSHGGNVYEVERKLGKGVVDFSANINPFGIPSAAKKILRTKIDSLIHYPDPDAYNLKKALARYWNVRQENILVGNGSTELIYLIMSAFNPSSVAIPVPSFSEYERAAGNLKTKIKFIPLEEKQGFKLNATLAGNSDVIFLCNPNNPTGNLILEKRADIKKLSNRLIVMDESFMDFLPDERKYTLIKEAQKSKKIIVLRTLTKFFALAGLRVGYLAAHKSNIDFLKKYQAPWSVNVLAQKAGERVLSDKAYIDKTKKFMDEEREYLYTRISNIRGLSPFISTANYILMKIEDEELTSFTLKGRLLKKGILIRDCSNFRGLDRRFIRVAVRSRRENLKLVKTLEKVL